MKYIGEILSVKINTTNNYNGVYLCNSGVVLKGLRLIKASVFDNVSISHFYKYAIYKKLTEPSVIILHGNNLIVHNHWSTGYHHWLTESLRRLLYIDPSKYNLIIPEDYPKFAFDSLDAFSFKTIIKLPKRTGAKVKELVIPPNYKSGYFKQQQLLDLRNILFEHYKVSIKRPKKRIYISRKSATRRKVENELELIDLLKDNGFLILELEDFYFSEQVKLFSDCEILISIHGAGLTNCIFMQENTYLLEFYKQGTFINYCFERMANELNINYDRQLCIGGKNIETHVDKTDLIVDINLVAEYLKRINIIFVN